MNTQGRITQDENFPTDYLETMSPANPSTPDIADESASSESDAGLDDSLTDGIDREEANTANPGEIGEDDGSEYSRREIPMSDLPDAPREDYIHSPEMSDLNIPGEIDIEDLDEEAVSDALPPDARLDPLEE